MRFLIYLILVFIGFVIYVRFVERRTVFLPAIGKEDGTPEDIGLTYENIFFKTQDGLRLHGWFVPAVQAPQQAVTCLFFHGNAGNINNRLEKIQMLFDLGMNVFIFDYRGYGISQGCPSEKGIYLDAMAAFDYLTGRRDIRHDRILAYGASLGGAAATELALHRPVKGLVLHSTFTSAKDVGKKILPFAPRFLIRTDMGVIGRVPQISIPKLIIHSPQDEVIPYEMGERLFEAAAGPKEFLRLDGAHNDNHVASYDVYMKGMREFLGKYF